MPGPLTCLGCITISPPAFRLPTATPKCTNGVIPERPRRWWSEEIWVAPHNLRPRQTALMLPGSRTTVLGPSSELYQPCAPDDVSVMAALYLPARAAAAWIRVPGPRPM